MDWFEIDYGNTSGVPFGVNAKGLICDVSEVPRGLACECFCSDCGGPLVAKKGEIKVHHFAHHDRRECRHAFEASLFHMAIDLLSRPGAQLMLPGWGNRNDWVRGARLDQHDPKVTKFLQEPTVIPAQVVEFGPDLMVNARRTSDSVWSTPEIELSAQNLSIHLLTHHKPFRQCPPPKTMGNRIVIAINLSHYAKIWWGRSCDTSREERIAEASSARNTMAEWLAKETSGRGLLHHPDRAKRKQQFETWANELVSEQEKRRKEAQREHQRLREAEEKRWRVPPLPEGSKQIKWWFKPASSEQISRLPSGLPLELGLLKDNRSDRWGWFGKSGQTVPSGLRTLLATNLPWEPRDTAPTHGQIKPSPPPFKSAKVNEPPNKPSEPELLKKSVGTCQICSSPTNLSRNRVGMFAGKLVISCSQDPRHPTVYPADSDWPEFIK